MSKLLKNKLRELRNEKKISLDKLAELTDSSKSYLWELENRDKGNPSAEKLAKIASVLGVTSDYLLDESVAEPNEEVLKEAFFRKFEKMDPEKKKIFEDLLDKFSTG